KGFTSASFGHDGSIDSAHVRFSWRPATGYRTSHCPEEKRIEYQDDGTGMSFDELNDKYLLIGRNRRVSESDITPKGRKVIGKKGLGKLSIFGICDEVKIRTIKNGILNEFIMNLDAIKKSEDSSYYPDIVQLDMPTIESSGTSIELRRVRRKSPFDCNSIAQSLSKKFLIFDSLKTILLRNEEETIEVSNELKFEGFREQFSWEFPLDELETDYAEASKVKGKIITLETPVKDTEMKGVYLVSRGKLVNKAEFYGLRDTDQFHTYITGYLQVDFIDEMEEDVISTDRQSLNWENDRMKELREYLQAVIKKIASEWKKKRSTLKKESIKHVKGIDIEGWQRSLPTYERSLSERIINPVLENSTIDVDDSSEIIGNVIDKFENQTFKEYACKIADLDKPEEIPMLLKIMEEWKAVESRQYCDLAVARIEVIQRFEEYIKSDTREVPTLHNFLKQFSWLLDPRILEFKDEVHYSSLLKETYPEEDLETKDRRIDFLCSNALGGILYVIEIKRSKYKVDTKALEQALEYGVFLNDRYATESGFSKVVAFVVGGEKSTDAIFKHKEKIYRESGTIFVKTYAELLEQSKQYHKEFIDLYKIDKNYKR
ncbi:ATP-binding protein, partial [Phormidium sp. FACHB-1136]|uniref:ATP-binding protein n=1 Tax=Phormidium sp. FACHB-1136 TaxID=2692848 RepID=UPI00168839DB